MEQNPRTSLLRLSAQSGVALSTCQKIVKKRLNLHPYKMSLFQELKPADYPRRVAYCSWFLNNMNDNRTLDLSFFSNKAWSCVSSYLIVLRETLELISIPPLPYLLLISLTTILDWINACTCLTSPILCILPLHIITLEII
jgi:hypothetical protein